MSTYQSIPLALNDYPYDIDVGFDIRHQLSEILSEYNKGQIF